MSDKPLAEVAGITIRTATFGDMALPMDEARALYEALREYFDNKPAITDESRP